MGGEVTKGKRIARISSIDSDTSGKSRVSLEIENLLQARDLLNSQLSLTRSRIATIQSQSEISIKQNNSKIKLANILLAASKGKVKLSKETLDRASYAFKQGLITQDAFSNAKRNMIISQQAQSESNLSMLKATTHQIELDWQTKKIELKQSINTIEREIGSLARKLHQRGRKTAENS